ncbi:MULTISPECIES: DUF6507 family protein [unclassified Streptomyces]|uniref:DUF6507 family protein n=1 Tax=unclassified Streptomyces TaxID=2593676 RepID=UPI0037F3B54B
MVAWDIRPQGVQGQLKVVGTHAGDLEKALTALMATVSEAAQAAGTAVPGVQAVTRLQGPVAPGQAPLSRQALGPVAAALGEYLGEREKDFTAMAERIEAAVLGAVEATNAYCEGDLEAAEHAQNAAKAVRLDLLKDTGGHR